MGAEPEPARDPNVDPAGQQLTPGCVLENRFVIGKLLGRGGMGEVYEAEDLRLNRARIALKTIRPDYISHADVRTRFQREVLLARSIAHPNVCPVHEFFSTLSARGEIWFLTMKLLRGETLSARLKRSGRLPVQEALAIARGVGAALEAAHRAGVVHRDLKPGNIFLEDQNGGVRPVVTDFGLAKIWAEGSNDSTAVAGTPGYIAPETLLGRPATPAGDVYCFGVVLRDMIFGQAKSATGANAETESIPKDALSRGAMNVIRRCMEAKPELRFPSAAAVVEGLDGLPRREPMLTSRRKVLAGSVGAIAALAGAGWLSKDSIENLIHPVPRPRRVALLPAPGQGGSPQDASLLSGLLDTVSNELARAEQEERDLFVVPPRYLRQQNVSEASQAVGLFGTTLLLSAALVRSSEAVEIPLKLMKTASGEIVRRAAITCPLTALYELPTLVVGRAAALLDISRKNLSMQGSTGDTTNAAAFAGYARARDLLYANTDRAIAELQKAVELDPRFAKAWAALADAYARRFHLTRDQAALDLAERNSSKALELAPDLPAAYSSRAAIEVSRGKYDAAIADLQRALRIDPVDANAQLTLAHAYRDSGQANEADRTYGRLLTDNPNNWPAMNDWANFYIDRADYAHAEQLLRQATIAAPDAALPWRNLGAVYLEMGKFDEANRALTRSISLLPSAEAYSNQGTALFWLGKYKEAAAAYQKGVDFNPGRHGLWRNLGDAYEMLHRRAQAMAAWQKAADLAGEELKVNPNNVDALVDLATYRAKLGEKSSALELLGRAASLGKPDADRVFREAVAYELAGERGTALRLVGEAARLGYSHFDIMHAPELQELRKDPRFSS